MTDTVYIRYYIETDRVGSREEGVAEFDRADWEAMSPEQQEAEIKEEAFNFLSWGFKEITAEQAQVCEDDADD